MNQAMGIGITERLVYGVVAFLIGRYGEKLGLSQADSAWLAGGLITLVGGARAWYVNRPEKILDSAAAQIPNNAKLVVQISPNSSSTDQKAVQDLGAATGPKVEAKIAA